MDNLESKVNSEYIIKNAFKEPTIYDLCFFIKYYYFPIIYKMKDREISNRFLKDVNMLIRLFKMHYHDPINKGYTFKDKADNGEINLPELMVPVYERVIRHLILSN